MQSMANLALHGLTIFLTVGDCISLHCTSNASNLHFVALTGVHQKCAHSTWSDYHPEADCDRGMHNANGIAMHACTLLKSGLSKASLLSARLLPLPLGGYVVCKLGQGVEFITTYNCIIMIWLHTLYGWNHMLTVTKYVLWQSVKDPVFSWRWRPNSSLYIHAGIPIYFFCSYTKKVFTYPVAIVTQQRTACSGLS